MKNRFLLLLFCLALPWNLQSQNRCGVVPPQHIHEPAPIAGLRQDLYEIPVLFHVFHGGGILPVDPLTLNAVLDSANRMLDASYHDVNQVVPAFSEWVANSKIQLRLAHRLPDGSCTSGIEYYTHDFSQSSPDILSVAVETSHYLNVIVTTGSNSYATFPGPSSMVNYPEDRIVFIIPNARNSPETLVHELGHWLGLYHTFGPTNQTGGACGDDYVADTPQTRGFSSCETDRAECVEGIIENAQNFMDYSPCGLMFTPGQVARMEGYLNDTSYNRFPIWQAENLDYTGILLPGNCAQSLSFGHQMFPDCDSTFIRICFALNGIIPDSIRWNISELGLSSTHPFWEFYVSQAGAYTIDFRYYQQGIEYTGSYPINVVLNQTTTAMPLADLPFSLDPDDAVLFPNPHINLINSSSAAGWQVCNFAGYQSSQCLYVPARVVDESTTTDLELGMFDFSGLTTPTVSFRVAAAMVSTGSFHTLEILFRDECSSIFSGNIWLSKPLYELFNGNTTSGFIPQNDAEWFEVTAPFPVWNLGRHSFVTLRLRTSAMPLGFSGEPFYVDAFRIGEQEIPLDAASISISEPRMYPKPWKRIFHRDREWADSGLFDGFARTGTSKDDPCPGFERGAF